MKTLKNIMILLSLVALNSANAKISEADYNNILDDVLSAYEEDLGHDGIDLIIKREYHSPIINASSYRLNNSVEITVFGGIVKAPEITKDALALVACHELGHYIGDGQQKTSEDMFASGEGQSDYFATAKCLKKVMLQRYNPYPVIVAPEIRSSCKMVFSNYNDVELCTRAVKAGTDVTALLSRIAGSKQTNVMTPDKTIVTETYNGFTNAQCRLDTFFAGALCNLDIESNEYCLRRDGYQLGVRPLCWFSPY